MLWMLACIGAKKIEKTSTVWLAPLEQSHALVGKVWAIDAQKWITYSDMVQSIQSKEHIFIGEKHDNPDHHRWQGKILNSVHHDRTVAFEMLNVDQKNTASVETSLDFAESVSWEQSGWPEFSLYAPIFDVVFTQGLSIVFAHPSRTDIMRVMKEGANKQEEMLMSAGIPLSESSKVELREEIVTSHCGHAPDAMVEMMLLAQQYKDAFMADRIQREKKKSVVIAGTGHTRSGKGLPRFFSSDQIAVVHLVEVEPEKEDVHSYRQNADYLVFTPRMSNEDPCDVFRTQLEQMKR